eukprot:7186477-Prymnesium_polylepis.7
MLRLPACVTDELRVYWFEVFECGRKVALVGCVAQLGSPPPTHGSPGQLILGLIVCFLTCNSAGVEPRLLCTCGRLIGGLHPCGATDGMYTHFAPYEGSSDGSLAQLAQLTIFFSLVASLVTNAYPEE